MPRFSYIPCRVKLLYMHRSKQVKRHTHKFNTAQIEKCYEGIYQRSFDVPVSAKEADKCGKGPPHCHQWCEISVIEFYQNISDQYEQQRIDTHSYIKCKCCQGIYWQDLVSGRYPDSISHTMLQ